MKKVFRVSKLLIDDEVCHEKMCELNCEFLTMETFRNDIMYFKANNIKNWKCMEKYFKFSTKNTYKRENLLKMQTYISTYKGANPSLIYDIEYTMLKYNTNKNNAIGIINKCKANKATSLNGFITRHGEIEGKKKFEKFQITSRKSSDNIKQQLTKDEISIEYKNRSKRCIEYWTSRGFSKNEAIVNVSNFQKYNSGVNLEYYESRDYDVNEIEKILLQIREKCSKTFHNKSYLKEVYGEDWFSYWKKFQDKMRKNMEDQGKWIKLEDYDKWELYRYLVTMYTNQTIEDYDIKNIENRSKMYHLDHKYSIKQGFLDNISAKIIGSFINLEMLTRDKNCKKKEKCSITQDELLLLYEEFINENKKNNTQAGT